MEAMSRQLTPLMERRKRDHRAMLPPGRQAHGQTRALILACAISSLFVQAALPEEVAAESTDLDRYRISVITLGPGSQLLTMFGHTAILLEDRVNHIEKTYNFGEFDYGQANLAAKFLSGELQFWVEMGSFPSLKKRVEKGERSLTVQTLALTPDETATALSLLKASTPSIHSGYQYHHYKANCCTKVRDLLDRALNGLLFRSHLDLNETFRYWTDRSSAQSPLLAMFFRLILNRKIDEPITSFDAMYLPSNLASGLDRTVRQNGVPLVDAKQVVFPDRRKPQRPGISWALIGFAAIALIISAAAPIGLGRRRLALNLFAVSLCLFGLIAGLAGVLLIGLWKSAPYFDLAANENLFVFPPTHLILAVIGIAILTTQSLGRRPSRILRIYLVCAIFAIVIHLLLKVGPLGQDNYLFSAYVLLFLAASYFSLGCKTDSMRKEAAKRRYS